MDPVATLKKTNWSLLVVIKLCFYKKSRVGFDFLLKVEYFTAIYSCNTVASNYSQACGAIKPVVTKQSNSDRKEFKITRSVLVSSNSSTLERRREQHYVTGKLPLCTHSYISIWANLQNKTELLLVKNYVENQLIFWQICTGRCVAEWTSCWGKI